MEQPTRILFVCHGNICRSTMAEYVMRHLAREHGIDHQVIIDSAATSAEELGNPVHPGTRRALRAHGIACGDHRARRIRPDECGEWDLIVAMDDANVRNIERRCGHADNVCKLLAFAQEDGTGQTDFGGQTGSNHAGSGHFGDSTHDTGGARAARNWPVGVKCRDVADPWYTGDFEATYKDVLAGCEGILRHLE